MENAYAFAEEKIQELLDLNEALEKNQAIYIAKKNDKIDQTLGDYLNKYPERQKMKIRSPHSSHFLQIFKSLKVATSS